MPTYQYTCTECGDQLEVQQSFTDEPLTTCSACGGRLRKVFNAVGVVFKGSGFYRTDSREAAKAATNGTPAAKTDSADKSASNGKDAATPSKDAGTPSADKPKSEPAAKKAGSAN